MRLRVAIRVEASRDASETEHYYEAQRPGLGQLFLAKLNQALQQISEFPLIHAPLWRDVRAARLEHFPYPVYYRIKPDRLVVIAILHGNRSDAAWKKRARLRDDEK